MIPKAMLPFIQRPNTTIETMPIPSIQLNPPRSNTKIDAVEMERFISQTGYHDKALPYHVADGFPSSVNVELTNNAMHPNHRSATDNPTAMQEKINTWLNEGFIREIETEAETEKFLGSKFVVHPMGLVTTERNGKVKHRPVSDASFGKISYNGLVEEQYRPKLELITLEDVIQALRAMIEKYGRDHIRIKKTDLRDAYLQLHAALKDLKYQVFRWLKKFYVIERLCFGAIFSGFHFARVSNFLVAYISHQIDAFKALAFFDDIISSKTDQQIRL